MLKIFCPNNFILERQYIIDVIFNEFLGIKYSLKSSNKYNSWIIELSNGALITFDDHFFSKIEDNDYLKEKYLPDSIKFLESRFFDGKIKIIYGNGQLECSENRIQCGADIFSSAFFMLSRWEEVIIKQKDIHNRIKEEELFCIKHNIYKWPVVNEYTEFLWNLLKYSGFEGVRKERKYKLTLTHDVDNIFRYDTLKKLFKALVGDIILRKSITLPIKTLWKYLKIKLKFENDPYDTFEYLMDISDSYNLKSHFYFIPSIKKESYCTYNINSSEVKNIIRRIINKGHIVGIHGSYLSGYDINLFTKEIERLKEITDKKILEGRQHFLRCDITKTLSILDKNSLKYDSSFGFSAYSGFKAGTCYEYSLFDINERKKLSVKERPLVVMDVAMNIEFSNEKAMLNSIKNLKDVIRKYNGNFVLLWHNENIFHPSMKGNDLLYKKILQKLVESNV
jgi:Family of unknown function (DUF7033)